MSKHDNEAGASVTQNSMRPVSAVKEEESDGDGDDDDDSDVLGQSMGSTTGLPVLRRRDTMLELSMTEVAHSVMRGARKLGPFERAVLELFDELDPGGDGSVTDAEFLEVFQRKELGLKLTDQEATALQSMAGMGGGGGSVSYREFMPKLEQFVVNLFKTRWVDDDSGVQGGVWHCVQSKASGWVYVNKNTGVGTYEIPDELHVDGQAGQDLIGRALRHFLDAVAVEPDAIVDALTSPALGLHLTDADATSVVSPLISDGTTIDVATFAAGVDKQIQWLHQARSPSVQDWAYINAGTAAGMVWVNKRSLAASRVVPSDVLEVLGRAAGSGEPRGKVAPAIHAAKEEARLHELALKAEIQSARSQLDQLQGLDADNVALGESVDGAQTALEKALAGLQQLQDSYDLVTKLEQTDKIGAENADERRRELAEHLRGVALEIEQEEQAISAMRRRHKNELDRANKELDNTNGTEAQTRADADELQEEQTRHRARIKSNAAENEALSSIKQKYEELQAEHGKLRVKCDERGFQLKQARTQLSDTLDKNRNLTKSVERLGALKQSAEISAEKHTTAQEFLAAKTKLLKSKESELAQLHAHIRELQTRDAKRNVLLEELMGGRRADGGKPMLGDVDGHLFTATSPTADKSPGARFASAASTLSPSSDVVRHRQTNSGKLRGSGHYSSRGETLSGALPSIKQKSPTNRTPSGTSPQKRKVTENMLEIGVRIVIRNTHKAASPLSGVVKYVGPIAHMTGRGPYVGVKLDDPAGNCDGTHKGTRYFKTPDKHGLIIPLKSVLSVQNSNSGKSPTKFSPSKLLAKIGSTARI